MVLHAWLATFEGDRWYTFDATPTGPRRLMTYGRDAAYAVFISNYATMPLVITPMRVQGVQV